MNTRVITRLAVKILVVATLSSMFTQSLAEASPGVPLRPPSPQKVHSVAAKVRPHQASLGWQQGQQALSLSAINCDSQSFCIGLGSQVGNSASVVANNQGPGGSWHVVNSDLADTINAITCPTPTTCVGVGFNSNTLQGAALYSSDNGASWQMGDLPIASTPSSSPSGQATLASSFLRDVSCTSPSACWAIGNAPYGQIGGVVLYSSDSGVTWSVIQDNFASFLTSISCVGQAFCATVGAGNVYWSSSANLTSMSSSPWSTEVFSATSTAQKISCPTAGTCFILAGGGQSGSEVFSSSNLSAYAITATLPSSAYMSMSCPSIQECFVVGQSPVSSYEPPSSTIAQTTNAGLSWTSATSPVQDGLSSVSCTSPQDCYATSSYSGTVPSVISTTDAGLIWNIISNDPATDISSMAFTSMTCPSSQDCFAIANDTYVGYSILTSMDGGTSWNLSVTTGSNSSLSDITCFGSQDCWAVGSGLGSDYFGFTLIVTTNGGDTWTNIPTPPSIANANSISCVSTTTCLVVGSVVGETTDGGSNWTVQNDQISDNSAGSLLCVQASTNCWISGGNQLLFSSDLGASWYVQSLPSQDFGIQFTSMTCFSSTNCLLVGSGYFSALVTLQTSNAGSTWTTVSNDTVPGLGIFNMSSLSCPDTLHCWAIGTAGNWGKVILTSQDGGASWEPELFENYSINALSCSTDQDCVAVGGASGYGNGGILLTTTNGGFEGAPTISTLSQTSGTDNVQNRIGINGTNLSSIKSVSIQGSSKLLPFTIYSDSEISVTIPPTFSLSTQNETISVTSYQGTTVSAPETYTAVKPTPLTSGDGFWLLSYGDSVSGVGSAPYLGDPTNFVGPNNSIPQNFGSVGIAGSPDGDGYWVVSNTGAVENFGTAKFWGDLPTIYDKVTDIVAIQATSDGKGYYLFGADGGVFAFGDAKFLGSATPMAFWFGGVVGAQITNDNKGYWLVTSTGQVFNFGDARYFGSSACTGCRPLQETSPVVSLTATSDDKGYWILFQDGDVGTHGDATDYSQISPNQSYAHFIGLISTPDSKGYWLLFVGGIFQPYGDAQYLQSYNYGNVISASS